MTDYHTWTLDALDAELVAVRAAIALKRPSIWETLAEQEKQDAILLQTCRPGDPEWQKARERFEAKLQSKWDD